VPHRVRRPGRAIAAPFGAAGRRTPRPDRVRLVPDGRICIVYLHRAHNRCPLSGSGVPDLRSPLTPRPLSRAVRERGWRAKRGGGEGRFAGDACVAPTGKTRRGRPRERRG